MMKPKKMLIAFMILALIAVPITIYLTALDFRPDIGGFCQVNDAFDCVSVSQSEYSRLLGVPVAIWGFLTYTLLFILALGLYKDWDFKRLHKKLRDKHIYYLLAFITAFGTLFSLYLTYAEFFIIKAFCIFCLAQQGIIIIMFLLALWMSASRKISL